MPIITRHRFPRRKARPHAHAPAAVAAPHGGPLIGCRGPGPEFPADLLLFRVGGRGYACRRSTVIDMVDLGGGLPPVAGLPASSLRALEGEDRTVIVVALRLVLGMPQAATPSGRILIADCRDVRAGFLVDEVVGIVAVQPEEVSRSVTRLPARYATGVVDLMGRSWLLIDWDAMPMPAPARGR